MDKTFLFFVVIGIGFLYFVTNFVGNIQEEDDQYRNNAYKQEHKYDKYKSVDSVGQDVLNLLGANDKIQVAAWNESSLKNEFILLFPDFGDMKLFVKNRINGDALTAKLLTQITQVEDKFFAGTITADQAKQELSSLK
jgi:hypothetical protein